MSKKRNINAVYPLTPMQEGMLFHSIKDPDSGVYVEQLAARLCGNLDVEAFKRSWELIVQRHSVLRTAFSWKSLDKMMQVELKEVSLPLDYKDWRTLTPQEQNTKFDALRESDRAKGFNPAKAPLMRIALIRTGDEEHRLLWSNHHVLMDGWSLPIIMREVFVAYEAFRQGYRPMLPPTRPFRDYVRWLEQQDVGQAEGFWRKLLAGYDEPVRLRIEKSVNSNVPPSTHEQGIALSPELSQSLTQLARQHRVTLNTVISGAWSLLLSRYGGRQDVVFGATVAGRPADMPGSETMVGLFINTLPMRVRIQDDRPLGEWLRELQARQFEMRQYEYTPLVRVQDWSDMPTGIPLFETIFVFENYPVDDALKNRQASISFEDVQSYEQTNYPFTLVAGPGESIGIKASYNANLYDDEAVGRLLQHLRILLSDMVAYPQKQLGKLNLLSEEETTRLLQTWNQTEHPIAEPLLIHQRFEAIARRYPNHLAAIFEDESLTYAQLNARSNQIAHALIQKGVGPETLVGIILERSLDMPVAILGVLKAGGAYVPIDPSYPAERIRYMLSDSGVTIVISDQPEARDVLAANIHYLHPADIAANQPDINPDVDLSPENLAYVIYTSGSTGRPKGVMLQHLGLCNFVDAYQRHMDVRTGDRLLQFSAFSFDASVAEFFLALLTGSTLVLGPRSELISPEALTRLINRQQVTVAILPPAMLRALSPDELSSLRSLGSAGEACTPELVAKWANSRRFGNGYGPTETTIGATFAHLSPDEAQKAIVPIGRPVQNVRLYVLDEALRPVPIGVPGELYIAGPGVARGYLNRPGLTARVFVSNPFGPKSHARMYKTGDLVRYRSDGRLEFLGRVDFQVKVRGFRIELGEIDAILQTFADVRDAIVLAIPDDRGDNRLVGYVTPTDIALLESEAESNRFIDDLRQRLAARIPDYMVPSAFLLLSELPLTPSGKIDRRSLLSLDISGGKGAYEPPRTPTEELLAGIWEQVLGVDRVARNDNFFELGGHSILATQLASRIRKVFKVELPLNDVFEAHTLSDLADVIQRHVLAEDTIALPPIEPMQRDGNMAPLSLAQQRLWILDQLEPGNLFYNIPTVIRLTGDLNQAALEAALNEIVRRHEVLRTTFGDVQGHPIQIIHEHSPISLDTIDLCGLNDDERDQEVARLVRETVRTPFDLTSGPLLRTRLIRLAGDEHIAVLVMHHIVSDGWSMGVLINELTTFYEIFVQDQEPPLSTLPIQYADYAIWQRTYLEGDVLEQQLAYWQQQLADMPPLLDLPTDRPRPPIQTSNGALYHFRLSHDLSNDLKMLSRREGVTLFMTLLAGYQLLLARYAGQEDVAVGSAVANRSRAELESLIGFFVNTLVFRTDLSGGPSFKELLKRVREVTLGAFAHQDAPFEKLVDALRPERNLSHTPLFQAAFALQNLPVEARELPGLTVAPVEADTATAQYDLLLMMNEDDAGIGAAMQYNTDLFDESTIARMMRHLEMLLRGAVADPKQSITHLPLLTPEEREMMLVAWNRTETPYPETTIHALFEEHARIRPDAEAAVFVNEDGLEERLSYARLNRRANQLAHYLIAKGVNPGEIVGISVQRSLDMVTGILGILKAGGAYLPIDPTYPQDRIRYMLEDSGVKIVISDHSSVTSGLADLGRSLTDDWLLLTDHFFDNYPDANPDVALSPDDLAYVIYTSGSTGRPKGTLLRHRGLCNLADVHHRNFDMREGKRVLQFSPFSFDASVWETVMALRNGATLVLAPQEVLASGPALLRLMREHHITTATLPPSLLAVLDETDLPELDTLIAAGEPCSNEIVQKWAPGRHFFDAYGPTETTVCASMYLIDPERDYPQGPPIGKPISNFQLYVVDKNLQPLPVGVPGELLIGGAGLAVGYHNRPDLTSEKFIPNPFMNGKGYRRLYRSGDLVKFLPNGNIQFLGRIDHQVKVRGFRIELGEIEAIMTAHPQVVEGAVIMREDQPGNKLLAAYYATSGEALTAGDLRAFMRQHLPEYMLPNVFLQLEAMPLTPSNKIDRKALPAPDQNRAMVADYVAPTTETERQLATIVADLLGMERVGIHDNFFELGGHSLMATQFVSRVRELFGIELPLRTIFEHPSVSEIAAQVDALRGEQDATISDVADILTQLETLSDEEVAALLAKKMSDK